MVSIPRLLKLTIVIGLSAWITTASAAGPTLNLLRYRGKVVYLDFWASWCAPCKQSFPWMNAMQRKYGKQGLTIIAVNEDKRRQDANNFLKEIPAKFKIVYDPNGILAKRSNLIGLPSSFLIDRSGHIYRRHLGFSDSSPGKYELEIRTLLDKRPTPKIEVAARN